MSDPKRDELSVHRERAVLVGVELPDRPFDHAGPLEELRGLATSAGALVKGKVFQKRQKPDFTTYVGRGKVQELSDQVTATDSNVVIFDNELQPAQLKNLEREVDTKVIDRTELILDIFATRARTLQARLQVELAQLEYLRPRLKRLWTHLERHGGGIGTRGPGETQLETDRRLIDKKIRELKSRLAVIQQRKEREVKARETEPRVCLVGYTNAGKSTLMQRLTRCETLVADMLFATLDTRTRQWNVPGWGKILLSDTVGFIRNLPHDLVASFRATLEESIHADLLLHVVDASNPSAVQQIEAVNVVLEEIGARQVPSVLVLNQIDRMSDRGALNALLSLHPNSVAVSAHQGEGIDDLTRLVTNLLSETHVLVEIVAHAGNGKLLSMLSSKTKVISRDYEEDRVIIRASIPRPLFGRLQSDGIEIRQLDDPVPEILTATNAESA